MSGLAIRIPQSEWYRGFPLPRDYPTLGKEAQRLARINACRQFMLPDAKPSDWWASYVAFDFFYLQDFEKSRFYDEPPLPYGIQQKELIESVCANPRLVSAWPRGFTKSTTVTVLMLMIQTARPRFPILYVTGMAKHARSRLTKMMVEWESNDALISDFAPEYIDPGDKISFKPKRGTSDPWSAYLLEAVLRNGSRIMGGSVEGRSRGARSKMVVIDDPEKDFKKSTDSQAAREYLEEFIFKTTKPILVGKWNRMFWLGTRISRKHYLWSATQREDEKFQYWKILTYQAGYPSIDDLQEALWPEKMSVAGIKDEIQLSGRDFVLSEYFNEPGGGSSSTLVLHKDLHSYELLTPEGKLVEPAMLWNGPNANPRECDLLIRYLSGKTGKEVKVPLKQLLSRSPVFQSLDWARSISSTADYSASAVGVFGEDGELIVLDILTGRWLSSKRTEMVVRLAYLWHSWMLGVESPSEEHEILLEVNSRFDRDTHLTGYKPKVKRVDQFGGSKNEKVEGIAWRFGDPDRPVGFIKLPFFLRERPHWKMLFHQIDECNLAADDLGLAHDDALDAVRMLQDISGHKPGRYKPLNVVQRETALDLLSRGTLHDKKGHPLIEKVGIMNLSEPEIDQIIEAAYRKNKHRDPEVLQQVRTATRKRRRGDGLSL